MRHAPCIQFKDGQTASEFASINPTLINILNDMGRFCELQGRKFVITDLLSSAHDDALLGRVSTSHQDGRAADVSIKGWTEEFITQFKSRFEHLYNHYGAISKKDKKQRLIVDHVGTARHLHIQVKP